MYKNYFNIDELNKNQIKNIYYLQNNKKLYLYELYTNDDLKNYKNIELVRHDILSYGFCSGKFISNYNTIKFLALNNIKNPSDCIIERKKEEYKDDILIYTKSFFAIPCLVENKTKYYILNFDFDYKIEKYPDDYLGFENKHIEITDYIIEKIILSLNEILHLTKKQLEYIWACKNYSAGYHIYFNNIIVDKFLHRYIFDETIKKINNDKLYPEKLINKIFDDVVCKSNGLRLFYFKNKDNDYYFPLQEKSTYKFDTEPEKHFHLCILNTNYEMYNFNLKNNYEIIYKNDLIIDKKIIKNCGAEEEAIIDFKCLDIGDKKDLIISLGNVLSVEKRIDDYSYWISLIYLYLNFGLLNEIIELSKKSKKYDDKSYQIIMKIAGNKNIRRGVKIIGLGSLILWAKEDNFDLVNKIFKKYYLSIKLKINHIDEITQKIYNVKPDFIENSIYISDNAINFFTNKIKEYENNQLCIIIQSPTGSGKTTAINKMDDFITEYFKSFTFLSTVSRRSMVACQITAFSKGTLKFSSYLDENINTLDYFISSLEYLIMVDDIYDVIILDEINSLINYFYSETLKNKRASCIMKLLKLINKSKIIICSDANITDLVFSLFTQIKMDFIYYKNDFLNKKDIPLDIYYSIKYNEKINLLTFCDKFIVNKVRNKKSVLILTDSKTITEILKDYLYEINNDYDYFRVFNKDEGTLKDLIDIDKLTENRCFIANSKILYGIDITREYDEIFLIYRYASGFGIDCFCMIQQMSRSRHTKKVNMLVLDPKAKYYYNTYISYEENKEQQTKFINGYTKFHDELCKKHEIVNEMGCIELSPQGNKTFNLNSIMTEIHFIKTWYDSLFNYNKIDIVKVIAEKSYGYKINCLDWSPEEKYEFEFNKINIKEIIEVSEKILDNNIKDISPKYIKCIDNLQEQIGLRERYLKDINDNDEYKKLACNEIAFKNYIFKKYLDLNEQEFQKKIVELNNKDVLTIIKSDDLINKILNLFWLEKMLNIKRYDIHNIKIEKIDDIKIFLTKNVEKLYWFFTTNKSKNKTIKNVKNKIIKITSLNLLQKFIAECYNGIVEDVIKINRMKKYKDKVYVNSYYIFS